MYKLSICVPTYNRSECLRECVMSLVVSMQGYEDQVELVVSDDASPDNTEEVVRELQKKYPYIRYHRNPKNVHTDIHFSQIIERTRADFFWLMGDDDKVTPNAVKEVLMRIDRGRNLIVCNYSVWSKDFSTEIRKIGLGFKGDIDFNDPSAVLATFGINLGYISSVVGKTAHFLATPEAERKSYFGFTFPQIYPLYAAQLNDCAASLIAAPIVCNRSGNNNETKWHHIFVTGSTTIFGGLRKKGFSKKTIRQATKQVLIDYVISSTIQLKMHQLDQPGLLRFLIGYYKSFPLFWVTCVPILILPYRFLRPWSAQIQKTPFIIKRLYGTSV